MPKKTTSPHEYKWRPALFLMLLLAGVLAGWQLQGSYFTHSKHLDILADILKELDRYYVDDVDTNRLAKQGIDAILESLDPYTSFLSEEALEHFQTFTTGSYGGIGALLGSRKGRNLVMMLYKDRPAYKSGLRIGDEIRQINGEDMIGQPLTHISSLLKGMPDTSVQVSVSREGTDALLEFTLNREQVALSNVAYHGQVGQGIGYIKLTNFTTHAAEEVKAALKSLKKDGVQQLILDLRGNPGGILEEAIKVVNLFIDKNLPVVATKGKITSFTKTYKTSQSAYDREIPLVVLVDADSASASEIVAGVIQDYDRGILIGESTYGKGLVQTTRPLSHSTQLKLTVSRYYIPSGRSIQRIDQRNHKEEKIAKEASNVSQEIFKTRIGRPVYEGSGITPDMEATKLRLAPITMSLLGAGLIFDYATVFQARGDCMPAKNFVFSNKEYIRFLAWLEDKNYVYSIEPKIEQLLQKMQKEFYPDDIKTQLVALKSKAQRQKVADLQKFKSEIKLLLQQEIIMRYHFQEGAIEAIMPYDQAVQKACALLQDMSQYHQHLKVKI